MAATHSIDHYERIEDERIYVRMRPEIYGSSRTQSKRTTSILENGSIQDCMTTLPAGLEHCLHELLSNVADSVTESRAVGRSPGVVRIDYDGQWIHVENSGQGIPNELKDGIYVPELIFGTMRSSSNYSIKERTGAGLNGIGAKFVNIMSKEFRVENYDGRTGYYQVWQDGMMTVTTPDITPDHRAPSIRISYLVDFEYFGYPEASYPEVMDLIIARYALDLSFNSRVPVYLNETLFQVSSLTEYARYYHDGEVLIYSQPDLEVAFFETPFKSRFYTFTNGIRNRAGGVHYEAVVESFSKGVKNLFKIKAPSKSPRAKEKSKPVPRAAPSIKVSDIMPHVSVILCYQCVNPEFEGQGKTLLKSPEPKVTFPNSLFNQLKQWSLLATLQTLLDSRITALLSKGDIKKKVDRIHSGAWEEANLAGTSESGQCRLYVTEGNSAMGYFINMLEYLPGKRDYNGVFPIRGKFLNASNASIPKLSDNVEVKNLKMLLHLEEGLDYSINENFSRLRYGQLVILSDADMDGIHIRGLLMNYFYMRFKSLYDRGFIAVLRTPLIRVGIKDAFFSEAEFHRWHTTHPGAVKARYLKGLGSSEAKDIVYDVTNDHTKLVTMEYDDQADEYFPLAFNRLETDRRKEWLRRATPDVQVEELDTESLSCFINFEFIHFSRYNLARAVPRMMDGLKPSQRKLLCASFQLWHNESGAEKKLTSLVAKVMDTLHYHHSDTGLGPVVIGMGQNYIGSNNIPYFEAPGNYGSREQNGKDSAAPRYLSVAPYWATYYLFNREDEPLLHYLTDEGDKVEPDTYLPILPTVLINGADGIGTAYSSFIPCYNPLDLIEWFLAKLEGRQTAELKPWYRGFKGNIHIVRGAPLPDEAQEEGSADIEELGEDNVLTSTRGLNMIVEGLYRRDGQEIEVYEIPITRSVKSYNDYYNNLVITKKIKNYRNNGTAQMISFKLELLPDKKGEDNFKIKDLRLTRRLGLTNMVLLDNDDRPQLYKSAEHICQVFYTRRLPVYNQRRLKLLSQLEQEMESARQKIRFIELVLKEEIKLNNGKKSRPKAAIRADLQSHKLNEELLKCPLTSLTEESVTKAQTALTKLKEKVEALKKKKPGDLWREDLETFREAYQKHGN